MEQFYLSFYFGWVKEEDMRDSTVKSEEIEILVDGSLYFYH